MIIKRQPRVCRRRLGRPDPRQTDELCCINITREYGRGSVLAGGEEGGKYTRLDNIILRVHTHTNTRARARAQTAEAASAIRSKVPPDHASESSSPSRGRLSPPLV